MASRLCHLPRTQGQEWTNAGPISVLPSRWELSSMFFSFLYLSPLIISLAISRKAGWASRHRPNLEPLSFHERRREVEKTLHLGGSCSVSFVLSLPRIDENNRKTTTRGGYHLSSHRLGRASSSLPRTKSASLVSFGYQTLSTQQIFFFFLCQDHCMVPGAARKSKDTKRRGRE